jgi:hemoglobin
MSNTSQDKTLYQRIGGQPAISAAVDLFYRRVLADPLLSGFFSGASMERLKAHQAAFLSQALGGPRAYSGESMQHAHRRLAIEQRHFDSVALHLVETLRSLAVPENIVAEIAAAIAPLAQQIVNTPSMASMN